MDEFIPCTLMALPDDIQMEAARHAIEINPANAPLLQMLPLLAVGGEIVLTPDHAALLTGRSWGAGASLSVRFLDTQNTALQNRILSHFNAWGETANVEFSLSASLSADVRVTTAPDLGHWSYLGTDCRSIPAGRATMNLAGFSMSTPESEYRRVARHESGHALALVHEHLRPALVRRLDRAKTIAYFMRTQRWSQEMVIQQVLTPLDESQLTANAADQQSVMTYQLPGSITIDGQPIVGGTDIDASDRELIARAYPKAVEPPPPPPTGKRLTIEFTGDYRIVA